MQFDLGSFPRPHYLVSVEEIDSDRLRWMQLRGLVVFPSSDETIADRRDHVNVAHHLFAVWNVAHIMCQQAGLKDPRAFATTILSHRPTWPDRTVAIKARAQLDQPLVEIEQGATVTGKITAQFFDETKKLCEARAKFVAVRG